MTPSPAHSATDRRPPIIPAIGKIVLHVRRVDLDRRNLTPSQRAAIAVELNDLLPRGGDRGNQYTGGKPLCCGLPNTQENKEPTDPQSCGSAQQSAAEVVADIGVSQRVVEDTAKVKKKAPELLDAVKEKKHSAHAAAQVADLPKRQREKIAAAPNPKAAVERQARKSPLDQ